MCIEKKVVSLVIDESYSICRDLILAEEAPDDEEMVLLQIDLGEECISCKRENFFFALLDLRIELEKKNIQIRCNGAAQNVYTSPMQLSMGCGRAAYKLYMGQSARSIDIVDIFDCNEELNFTCISEQSRYYETWLRSIR